MKSKSNKKYILFAIGALILVGIVIGVSYAIWQITLVQTEQNVVNADCFSVTLENEENDINIQTAFPITDEEGSALTPYTFTIKNNCNSKAAYEVNLESLNTTTLDAKYVKAKVDNVIVNLGSVTSTDDVTVANAKKSYRVVNGYMNALETKTIKLNLWMDYDTPAIEESMNKIFEAKMVVTTAYSEDSVNPTAASTIIEMAKKDTTNLATDDYGNIRYIGADPNNYISIDGDIWRIIGVMKDIDDGAGNKNARIKMVKSESIGSYSWDTSDSNINSGYGINEWSQADLMKLINPGYEKESIGGSLYWNYKSGSCYNGTTNATTSCDFSTISSVTGRRKLKRLIGDAVWNTGRLETGSGTLPKDYYTSERNTNLVKACTSCNDTVERTTSWTGLIGLIYPSDYGYATDGGSTTNRTTCLNTSLDAWLNALTCKNNDWLYINVDSQWTLMSSTDTSSGTNAFCIVGGSIRSSDAYRSLSVYPAAYLKASVKIQSGDGSRGNPFILTN